jgi:hypothetical protein
MNESPNDATAHFNAHGTVEHFKPFDRRDLLVAEWLKRQLPPRDFLLEGVLSTTSRWMISGDTGIGKTLLSLELGFAIAGGANFLNWNGVRPARVMYLDGEMPAETMKERIEAAAAIFGGEVALFTYNRDDLGPNAMPPLNKPEGQKWLWREIDEVKPDLIIFDSMMCLLVGPLAEEETWQPCLELVRQLSARHTAQIWINHTGHDATRSYGSKTKEWEFDSTIMLSKVENDETGVKLAFTKARMRTPKTAGLFKDQLIRRTEEGWTTEAATFSNRTETQREQKQAWMRAVYMDLSVGVMLTPGHNAFLVRKVSLDAIRHEMIKRSYLALENGAVPARERTAFHRAKEDLIRSNQFAGDEGYFWSIK